MSDKITLLKQRYALEQRIRLLQNSNLTESSDNLLHKMTSLLEHVNKQLSETGLPQDQMNSPMPMDNPILPQQVPVSEYDSHPDHEVQMARSDLYRAAKSALSLEKMLKNINEQQGLEGWVQAKITKAADYLDSVYHYLNYEMQNPSEGVSEASVAAYGPGDNPDNPERDASGGQPMQPGQASATPENGGATPTQTSDGMVKMVKLGLDRKPLGTPIMVRQTDIKVKQQQGYTVIGESKEQKPKAKVVHCSQCGKGFSGSGLTAPHHTGFSHCKDHKGMKVIAEDASGGASSAGGMAGSMSGNGFANGGPGSIMRRKPRKKKIGESSGDYGPHARGVADGYYGRPADPHKMVTDETGKRMRVKLTDPVEIADYMAGYKDDSFGRKDYGESVENYTINGKKVSKDEYETEMKKAGKTVKEETGPKFTGYWKGKDKGKPGKKMVGDA